MAENQYESDDGTLEKGEKGDYYSVETDPRTSSQLSEPDSESGSRRVGSEDDGYCKVVTDSDSITEEKDEGPPVQIPEDQDSLESTPASSCAPEKKYIVTNEFRQTNEDELNLLVGQLVVPLQTPDGGWWEGRVEGSSQSGWFPCNHVAPYDPDASLTSPTKQSNRTSSGNQSIISHTSESSLTPQKSMLKRTNTFSNKLKSARSKINIEIGKELKIREGAYNMLKVLTKKGKKEKAAREEVLLTLSFSNSRIQALRKELQRLNSNVHDVVRKSVFFQNENIDPSKIGLFDSVEAVENDVTLGMVAFPLKETLRLNLMELFGETLQDFYDESPLAFEAELATIQTMRDEVGEMTRESLSRDTHFAYFHQLVYLEHRFFVGGKHPKILFSWFDAFNGEPSMQRSIAFEKACVLFNVGALCTHAALESDFTLTTGLDTAMNLFQTAAGIYQYILETFGNPPSADLAEPTLRLLISYALAQAQECHLLRAKKEGSPLFPGECATVSEMYRSAHIACSNKTIEHYTPPNWRHTAALKALVYEAHADYHTALEQLSSVQIGSRNEKVAKWTGMVRLLRAQKGLRKARNMCLDIEGSTRSLAAMIDSEMIVVSKALVDHNQDGSFNVVDNNTKEVDDMLPTKPSSSYICRPHCAELGQEGAEEKDVFEKLGSLGIFNADNYPGKKVTVKLTRGLQGYGFTLGGNNPVCVHDCIMGGPAEVAGLKQGQIIVAVNDVNVRLMDHHQVVKIIKEGKDSVSITVQGTLSVADLQQAADLGEEEDEEFAHGRQYFHAGFGSHSFALAGRRPEKVKGGPPPLKRESSVDLADVELNALSYGGTLPGEESSVFHNPLFRPKKTK